MKWLRLALILVALVALVSFSFAACDDDDPSTGSGQADDDDNDDAADDDLTDDDDNDATDDDDNDDDVTDDDDDNDDDNNDDLSPPAVGIGEPNMHALLELFGASELFGYHWGVGGWSAGETWDVGAYGAIAQKGGDMWGVTNDNVYLVSSFVFYFWIAPGMYSYWPVIMRFDGSNWNVDKIPVLWSLWSDFTAVHGNQDEVYAVGYSGIPEYYFIYKKNGGVWRMDHVMESQKTPYDVWVADDGVVIIVAALGYNESHPIVIEKRNAQWVEKEVDVPGRCVLYGVWGTDSQNVWLAGSCGFLSTDERPLLVFYDGDVFTETTVPDSEEMGWRRITGHEDGTMYLASWGPRPGHAGAPYTQVAVFHYDGDVWRNTNIPTEDEDEEITSMWLSEESGLYVTKHEELWRYYNEEWQKLPSPELMQIWGVGDSSP